MFALPDTMTSLPTVAFEFDPADRAEADALLSGRADQVLRRLLRDQESPASLLAARRVLDAFLGRPLPTVAATDGLDPDAIAATVAATRGTLLARLSTLEPRADVLRQRAPLALSAGCWLDTVSQAATQPSVIVNRLYGQHFAFQGEGEPQKGVHHLRRRALETAGVHLPEIDAVDFLRKAQARPLTARHALFYLALSRLAATFLPEVVGVHYVVHALGLDDALLGLTPVLDEPALRGVLTEYAALTRASVTGAADRRRLARAVELALFLETEHATMLVELAGWQAGLSLEAKVAAIIERHAPYAGRQHRDVRVGGKLLTETLADPDFDLAAFVTTFRESRQLKPIRGGDGRFLRAIKFGGPMFGIFDAQEAATFEEWAAAASAGTLPEVELSPNRVGDPAAAAWDERLAAADPADVAYRAAVVDDDRQLFHRLVNIETYANTLPIARARAAANLDAAEVLFTFGAGGHYTDASYFDYSADALYARVDAIYWDRLVNPYKPLTEIPDREEVVFGQKTFALGSLIDGSWAARIGNLGRYRRTSDGMLFSIYADEMGRGDLRKNHITLIHQVLASMHIDVPHIRDVAFLDQGELPDHLYGFSIHQLCLALFPDSYYNEILGYNLGIEMFGLGEMRLHERQKLTHHGFDPIYEEAHLSIDNISSGHARQSAEIIVAYLDDVERAAGASAVQEEWRRVWRGYASFAYFVEHALVDSLANPTAAELVI